jgi:flagellar motor protein MotB
VEVKKHSNGLFATLEGMPAHILIILGLALTLLAPLILNFKGATLASAQAEFDQMKSQKDLDLEEFKRDQADRRKKSLEVTKYTEATEQRKPVSFDPSLSPQQNEAQQKQEQEKDKAIQELKKAVDEKDKDREKALEEKKEELERKYDTIPIRREINEAQTAVAGTRSHLVLGWLGRLLLLVGLLVLMLQSEGLRQKVILVVLLVVMFSALSGVNLDFLAQGRMGGTSYTAPRMTERAPEAAPASKP